jgi:cell division protein FtsB
MPKFTYGDNRVGDRRKKESVSNSFFNNIVTKTLLLVISAFLLYNVGHSVSITIQKLDILQKAKIEVDNLRLKNLELALLLDSIQGTEYLEIQARDRLKLAGEGEYIFVIPEEVLDGVESELAKLLEERQEEEDKEVYEIWRDFLVKGV